MISQNPHLARGYIASGEFNGNRAPQHIQNQIVKLYCDSKNLKYVLSRAEYWINGSTSCQLWAALREGFKHIVFFSIWQLPKATEERQKVYKYCDDNNITLHFASERINSDGNFKIFDEIEIMIKINYATRTSLGHEKHFKLLNSLL